MAYLKRISGASPDVAEVMWNRNQGEFSADRDIAFEKHLRKLSQDVKITSHEIISRYGNNLVINLPLKYKESKYIHGNRRKDS